jgi:hypothetical protein
VFHPAGLGKNLFVFLLIQADNAPFLIEDNETIARGPQVNRADVGAHGGSPFL